MILALGALVLLVALPVHFLGKAFAPVDGADVQALHAVTGVGASNAVDRLFDAYLSRARRYRTATCVLALFVAVVLSFAFGANSIALGHTNGSPVFSDLLLMGFGGYLFGAVLAEVHHLRRRRSGVRLATLAPRRLDDYALPRHQWLLRATAGGVIVALVVGLVLDRTEHRAQRVGQFLVPSGKPNSFAAPLVALAVVALLAWILVERTQRAVVARPRPAMPDDLAAGDDAIRRVSVDALALGGAGLVAMLLSYELSVIGSGISSTGWQIALGIFFFVSFFASVVLAFRTRRLAWPRRRLQKDGVLG